MESNKQEESNLLKDNPVPELASVGSWMSKHVSPISMGTPLEGNKFGKAMADNDGDYEKAKASMAPQMNSGALYQLGSETKSEKEEKKEKPKPKKKQTFFDKQVLPQIKLDRLSKKQLKRMRS